MGRKYNVSWVVFLQVCIISVLFWTPGSSYTSIPVYLSQFYLLLTVLFNPDNKIQVRGAVALTIAGAAASVIAAYAARYAVTGTYDIVIANIHFGVMLAVAVAIIVSSFHIWSNMSGTSVFDKAQ